MWPFRKKEFDPYQGLDVPKEGIAAHSMAEAIKANLENLERYMNYLDDPKLSSGRVKQIEQIISDRQYRLKRLGVTPPETLAQILIMLRDF